MAKKTFSKKKFLKEWMKCKKNPIHFIQHHVKISHPQKGLLPFRLYDFQKDLVRDFEIKNNIVILKARQLGISTVTAAYVVWNILFQEEKKVVIIATCLRVAQELMKKVKKAFDNLPEEFKKMVMPIAKNTQTEFGLANGSELVSLPASENASRSLASSLLIFDEAAFIDNMGDVWTAAQPTLSTGGKAILLSTPNGLGNLFYEIYSKAESGQNDFYSVRLPWDVHPERDIVWYNKFKNNAESAVKFSQEYECSFIASGRTVIDLEDIARLDKTVKPPVRKDDYNKDLWYWEKYNPRYEYLMSVDVARGDGGDYSAFHVFNTTKNSQAAEFKGKIEINLFAELIEKTSKLYNDCLVVVENNNLGYMLLDKLLNERKMTNIFFSSKKDGKFVTFYEAINRNDVIAGLTTSVSNRSFMISKMSELIHTQNITLKSRRTLSELQTFIWHNNKPQAASKKNDDLVMALAFGCWVKEMVLERTGGEAEFAKNSLKNIAIVPKSLPKTEDVSGYNTKNFGIILNKPVKDQSKIKTREHLNTFYKKYGWLMK